MPVLLLLTLALLTIAPFRWNNGAWRQRLLRASILFGVLVTVITEGLSLLHGITFWGLTAAWVGVLMLLCAWILRYGGFKSLPKITFPAATGKRWLLAGILLLFLATGLVAALAPVQTSDSMTYHMSRVAHWAQNRSVAHYTTGIERQLFMSPLAEYIVLHVFVLGRGDTLVNLPNWFTFIGLGLAVSWIAAQFGAGEAGQMLAALFSAAVPIAIAQASSTTTDLLTAFWVVCLAAEVLAIGKQRSGRAAEIFIGMAAGLAVLTKPTGAIFALPLLAWIAWIKLRREGWQAALRLTAVTLIAVMLLNAGIFSRNLALYGHPLGPVDVAQYHSNQIYGAGVLVSNLVRNLAVHLGSIGPLNRLVTGVVEWIHSVIGMDPSDRRTSLTMPFVVMSPRNEDVLGNLVPLLLFLAACIAWFGLGKKRPAGSGWYALCLWLGFLLYSLLNRWQLFATRLQLPFFMLAAPFSAVIIERLLPWRWRSILTGLVFLSALPWAFSMFTRPIIPIPGWTEARSILTTNRDALMFSSMGKDQGYYEDVAAKIKASGCHRVQFLLQGSGPEYLWWKVLDGGLNPDLQIEWRVVDAASAQLFDPDFKACAAIVDDRIPSGDFPDLNLVAEHRGVYFFLKEP